jgi:hypothetical protein
MKRVHVFEFEDAAWFPSWLRASMTNVIAVMGRAIGVDEVLSELVSRVLAQQRINRIVDLGSGAGGVMPDVVERIRSNADTAETSLLLTDLYPNGDAIAALEGTANGHVRYERESVDATDLASAPTGLKTMVNCFHHMRPEQARLILESARESRQPLLIYEMGDNKMPFALWCLGLPIAVPLGVLICFVLTPFVRPLTVRQLIFTYAIPLVPMFWAWDGQASMPRIYTPEDLDELLRGLESEDYVWEKGEAKTPRGAKMGNYLLGFPAS